MVEIFDFSQWQKPEGLSEGSGASEKIWLQSPDGTQTGLFKFPKTRNYSGKPETTSTEHVSEWLASQLGKIWGIPCAEVKLGNYHGRKGSLSVLITDNKEEHLELNEGVAFIKKLCPKYDAKKMIDKETGTYYCLGQILEATKEYLPTQFWIEVLLFDFMIGNTDRHQSNWALLKDEAGQYRPFCILDNITFTWKFICLLYPICMLVLFNIGVGLILSALFVFFRDIQYLWSVFTQLLMYMSAIFYTIDNYSPMVRNLFLLNPVYLFIRYFRKIVIEATIPSIWFHLLMLADVVIVLAVGCWVYKKYNHKFLYYV